MIIACLDCQFISGITEHPMVELSLVTRLALAASPFAPTTLNIAV